MFGIMLPGHMEIIVIGVVLCKLVVPVVVVILTIVFVVKKSASPPSNIICPHCGRPIQGTAADTPSKINPDGQNV